jgi:predicted nucleotidyltransferase
MAGRKNELKGFHQALADLNAWMTETDAPFVVIGGVAVALLGRPRVTRDLDVVVLIAEEDLDSFAAHGAKHGFLPRGSDALVFARKSRSLLMHHEPSKLEVDVALGVLGFEQEKIEHAQTLTVAGVPVRVPRPEDLFLLKAIAQRDRDIADLDGIVARARKLDAGYIRRRAKDLADLFKSPEVMHIVERFLSKKKRK